MSTVWSVPRDWEGDTVAILASGPSMSKGIADYVRERCRVIAVNNQGIDTLVDGQLRPALASWADVLYASDAKWWIQYRDRALSFRGDKVTVQSQVPFAEVLSLKMSRNIPYDPSPDSIVTGGNSGYAALHLAVQRGASKVILCGYDMREVGGKRHWFGSHEGKLESVQRYTNWIANFTRLSLMLEQMRVEVVNCTPKSALRCFKMGNLLEVL
jgi:hypothetical protein